MRVIFTPEMHEMYKKTKPYYRTDGLKITLASDAPNDIKEMDKKLSKLFDNMYDEGMRINGC